jgi:Cd2+/Zn2+-exporting ATPase
VLCAARLLALAGSAERGSSHPLAAALVGCAAARGAPTDLPVASCTNVPGQRFPCDASPPQVLLLSASGYLHIFQRAAPEHAMCSGGSWPVLAHAGQGVAAEVDGHAVAVGNARLLEAQCPHYDRAYVQAAKEEWASAGARTCACSLNMRCLHRLAGCHAPEEVARVQGVLRAVLGRRDGELDHVRR